MSQLGFDVDCVAAQIGSVSDGGRWVDTPPVFAEWNGAECEGDSPAMFTGHELAEVISKMLEECHGEGEL